MAFVKIPSIDTVVGSTVAAARRFPMTLLCAILATGILIYLTHTGWNEDKDSLYNALGKILMCCELGLPLFFGCTLLSEARKQSTMQKWIVQLISLGLIVGYYFTIGTLKDMDLERISRYVLFIITAHLFVSFAPFLVFGQLNGFWQYNKTLFLRFLLAALYTSVLFGGIALALWSIDELLHITINGKKYAYTWYILACIFNTCFFLAGVPAKVEELEDDKSYLKGLKVFTQYVLLPLVTLYLLILYAYIAKILLAWKLPKGLVSYLVIGYSVAGIFSLLLIYPIRHNEENKWIKIFSRWFYLALFPLIIMLCVSIFNRIAEYGITENRYFILVLALWLFFIATYFIRGRKENIKIIPITLCFIAFFTSFGPWGAFSVSEHSQKNHLEDILVKNKILVNGKIDSKNNHHVTSDESTEIWSVVEYLGNSNALDLLQPWFDDIKLDTLKERYSKSSIIVGKMNLVSENNKDWVSVSIYRKSGVGYGSTYSLNIKGFDNFSSFYSTYYRSEYDTIKGQDTAALGYFMVGDESFEVYHEKNTSMFQLQRGKVPLATFDLNGFIKKLDSRYDTLKESYHSIELPADKLTLDVDSDSLLVRFAFSNISLERNQDKIRINSLSAEVLTKRR